MDTLRKRVPIVRWLPLYTWSTFVCDMLAGLTVGLTAIPQGIAYAVVAGLEPQYGLYSGFMGCFVYLFLGSTKDVTIGPTAIMALMCQGSVERNGNNPDFAVLLCFLSGCIITLFGILHLGFLVDFISVPVTVGFTTASAITIASSQMKSLLGISGKSNQFLETWITVVQHIKETRYQDVVLGLVTIFTLVFLKKLNDFIKRKYSGDDVTRNQKIIKETIRFLSLARNAIVVVFGTGLAYGFYKHGMEPFKLTGPIGSGMPPFKPPPFTTTGPNGTFVNFGEMASDLGTSIISIPLIAILESIAIAKAFAKGRVLDATQEMLALGVSNMVGSFVSSMPVTGSFTRTAVNNASGVRTPLGGIFTGALVLLALGLLTSTFSFIPKATLAGVIISAMFSMIEYEEIITIWRTKKLDVAPLFATIIGCLFISLDYGILIGVGVNLVFILYQAARPKVTTEDITVAEVSVLLIRPEQNLIFPSAEYFREAIMFSCLGKEKDVLVILDGRNLHSLDSTVAKNLKILTDDLKLREQDIIFWNWPASAINICLGFDKNLGKYFYSGVNIETFIQERNYTSRITIITKNNIKSALNDLEPQQKPLLDYSSPSGSYSATDSSTEHS